MFSKNYLDKLILILKIIKITYSLAMLIIKPAAKRATRSLKQKNANMLIVLISKLKKIKLHLILIMFLAFF